MVLKSARHVNERQGKLTMAYSSGLTTGLILSILSILIRKFWFSETNTFSPSPPSLAPQPTTLFTPDQRATVLHMRPHLPISFSSSILPSFSCNSLRRRFCSREYHVTFPSIIFQLSSIS